MSPQAKPETPTKESQDKIVTLTEELVKLTKRTGIQTNWIIALTIIIAILTSIMAIPIIKSLF